MIFYVFLKISYDCKWFLMKTLDFIWFPMIVIWLHLISSDVHSGSWFYIIASDVNMIHMISNDFQTL